jgi:tetratricopeptide (TPR) repeat protein
LLAETGRLSEAVVESRRALDLDPLSSFVNSNLASILYFAGDYPAALEQTFKTLEIDRGSARAHRNLGRVYLAEGSFDKAVAEYQKAVELSPGTPEYLGELGYIFGKSGESYRAEEILRQLQRSFDRGEASSYQLALVCAGMGNRERTLKLLERALDERAPGIVQLQVARWFDSFRSESRFQDILRRAGFIRATNASV